MKKLITKVISFILMVSMMFNISMSVFASETEANYKNLNISQSHVVVDAVGVYINGMYYTQEQFIQILDNAVEVKKIATRSDTIARSITVASATGALVAGAQWIPGVGEVVITTAGVIVVGGAVIAAGTWIYNAVVDWLTVRAFNKSVEKAINSCNSNKQHHIMNSKHNWNKFNKDPKWSDVVPILMKVLKEGSETWEKNNQYIRTLIYKGETVVVRFIKDTEGLVKYISTAWCEQYQEVNI